MSVGVDGVGTFSKRNKTVYWEDPDRPVVPFHFVVVTGVERIQERIVSPDPLYTRFRGFRTGGRYSAVSSPSYVRSYEGEPITTRTEDGRDGR